MHGSSLSTPLTWMHHFMIYGDSFGCLEVIAESVLLDEGAKNSGGT
jgi:hypothetical protein